MKVDKEIRILAQLLEVKTELQEQALSRKGERKWIKKNAIKLSKIAKKKLMKLSRNVMGMTEIQFFLHWTLLGILTD